MTLLVTYVLIALGFSFLCSLLEATLLTVTPSSVEAARQQGKPWALLMEELKTDIDRPLSAILTLNTIAHTMGATGAGAQYAKVFGDATGGLFAGALTLAVLVLTEIIPKTLGARYAMFFAPATAHFLPWLQKTLWPIVLLCQQVTRLITFGKAHDKPRHREELLAVAKLGEKMGALKSDEGAIVRNILQLGSFSVSHIMTPRTVMYTLPASTPLRQFAKQIATRPFSRVPVYDLQADDIIGFVLRSDVLLACLADPEQTLRSVMLPLDSVPNVMRVDTLFRKMLREHEHINLVHDEFGTTVGLVTLEDVLETVVGAEIVDEKDRVADMQLLARRLWHARAARMGIEHDEPPQNS